MASALQVVVVLSGSMEPAFYRGDILFLYMGKKPFSAGEVVVFNINGRDIPIVHRIIKVHEKSPGSNKDEDVLILTKVRCFLAASLCGVVPRGLGGIWSLHHNSSKTATSLSSLNRSLLVQQRMLMSF
jgi:hypothetical protein